jgi:putative ABC transport system ATP-binding protein
LIIGRINCPVASSSASRLPGQPALILVDEPTGAVDSKTADGILSLFDDLNRDDRTIIVVTHAPELPEGLGGA